MKPYWMVLIPLVAALDDVFPYFQSREFDDGYYGAFPNRSYVTAPMLVSPRFNVLQIDPRCSHGSYTMISLRGDRVKREGQSPMIFDDRQELVWMNATYGETFGLGVQKYKGVDYLTFWQGDDSIGGHGEGVYLMLDSSYREIYRLTAGGALPGDLHEFRITKGGTMLVTQYKLEASQFGKVPGMPRKGQIWDSIFQDIDIETNEVLFEWHAADHYNVDQSDFPVGQDGRRKGSGYDFFHINSIDKDDLGNYLISSRFYQCLAYIDGGTGQILWELGGKRNSFKDLSDGNATNFGWQHDARWNVGHTGVTLFDNGARYSLTPAVEHSRGLHIALDLEQMTARVIAEYVNPRHIISASQGSMQVLRSGNVLLGFGYNAAWTEFTPGGEPLCDVHIGSQKHFNSGAVQTYKVSKYPWVGRPTTQPEIAFLEGNLYMSWNGATEVAHWVIQSSTSGNFHVTELADVYMIPKTGFETSNFIDCHRWPYVRAVAVDVNGQNLGMTATIQTNCQFEAISAQRVLDFESWQRRKRVLGFLGLVVSGVSIHWLMRWRRRRRAYATLQQRHYGEWGD